MNARKPRTDEEVFAGELRRQTRLLANALLTDVGDRAVWPFACVALALKLGSDMGHLSDTARIRVAQAMADAASALAPELRVPLPVPVVREDGLGD